jgi:hypothetical protein
VVGAQPLRRDRVVDDGADLVAHELGRQRVGPVIEQDVVERAQEGEAADLPACLEAGLQFLGVDRQRRHRVRRQLAAEAAAHRAAARRKPA